MLQKKLFNRNVLSLMVETNLQSNMKCLFFIFICISNLIYTLSTNELSSNNTEQLSDRDLLHSNAYLKYIFEKYGSNDGKISYEGFEHLLENLGLGQLKFEKEHSLEEHRGEDGQFQELHDNYQIHKHNHSEKIRSERSADQHDNERKKPANSNRCLTPEEIFYMYHLEPIHKLYISPKTFLNMCPVIVYELDQKSCSYHLEISGERVRPKMDNVYHVWLSALISVLVISLVGLLGVCMVPLLQKAFFNELLSFLVALAVGTLCGDSLLHLLPHAFERGKEEDPRMVVLRAGTVFLTIVFFYLIENLMSRSKNKISNKNDNPTENDVSHKIGDLDIQLQEKSVLHSHSHIIPQGSNPVSSVACMVIMGDGLHNLTDGLAIGAAFSGDVVSGFSTAVAVFTHELPHELGDFAVLLQSGMTVSQAIFYNIVSSILSFIGMVAGLLLGNFTSASHWIYAITAGAFLYIGLVNLVPEIKRPIGNGKTDALIQLAGILCGGFIMLLIALFEHDLENIFLQ